jgi:hypothetical protein
MTEIQIILTLPLGALLVDTGAEYIRGYVDATLAPSTKPSTTAC